MILRAAHFTRAQWTELAVLALDQAGADPSLQLEVIDWMGIDSDNLRALAQDLET
jgi:hypothetical protein